LGGITAVRDHEHDLKLPAIFHHGARPYRMRCVTPYSGTGEYIDDTAITTKVKAELLNDPVISGLSINVETFKGAVQLSGFANFKGARRGARELLQGS
jgi:osmotically-inducible protein OsmY